MNDKFKKLTIELCEILKKESLGFFIKKLEKEEDTSNIIDLVLSAHLSSAFSLMASLAEDHPKMKILVDEFIEQLKLNLLTISPIMSVEVLKL